jgi:hypothetical protein
MAGRRTSRPTALFLTALFIGSGFALPDLDALVYHSGHTYALDPGRNFTVRISTAL